MNYFLDELRARLHYTILAKISRHMTGIIIPGSLQLKKKTTAVVIKNLDHTDRLVLFNTF
ncbi:MAG: hypothetical protein CSA32_00700 [Desulfobulbus propionicus]|nr:MAG: hypothetical protein CSA32_00700 [Desulfobulbus propionicus]